MSGKQKWVSAETDVWTVAKIRLADERAKIERLRQTAADVTAGDASMGALVALYRQRVADRVDIRPDTRRRRGILRVCGSKTEAAEREVPTIPAAKALLERLNLAQISSPSVPKVADGSLDPKRPVLAVGEAAKSHSRACKRLGFERLPHHDLRDAFATSAIDVGVDIPTVAAWLGHADGGVPIFDRMRKIPINLEMACAGPLFNWDTAMVLDGELED